MQQNYNILLSKFLNFLLNIIRYFNCLIYKD